MEDVFISYVSADKELAAQIADALQGIGIRSNLVMLGLGDSLVQRIEQGLCELAVSLNIDYEDIAGKTKGNRVSELVGYCQRRGRLGELEQAVVERRPHLQW